MDTVTLTFLIGLLIFLLVILLGIQMQITTANRDLGHIEEELKRITDELRQLRGAK
jgi:hypothetical protein